MGVLRARPVDAARMGLCLHVHMLLHSSNSFGVALWCAVRASDGEFRTTSQKVCAFCLSSHCAQHRILHRWPSGALKRNKTLPMVAVDTGASEPVQPDELEAELEALCAEPALPAVNEHVEVRCGH